MNDVLPDEASAWHQFEEAARDVFERYGYRNLRVPIVEPTPLFVRGIGEHTDVVEKEMYTFEDKLNGESLTLRPEATAGIVRAAIEHNLTYERPLRVWTAGPMFRHERPQKGRYRQFHQLDVEALGYPGPDVDAEQIVMLTRLWRTLGLADITLAINSIGDPGERRAHRAALIAHFERHRDLLGVDVRAGEAERLDVELMELAIAALLRTLVAEHRSRRPHAKRPLVCQVVLDRRADDARCRFGTQRQALAVQLVVERVHLVLDDVGVLADAAHEQWRRLDDRHAQVAVAIALEHVARRLLELMPRRRLVGEHVVHATHRLQCFSHCARPLFAHDRVSAARRAPRCPACTARGRAPARER